MTKPAAGRRIEPPLDQLPRLEIVRQRQRAEIVAERRAGPRRDREHGGDAGHDGDVERPPGLGPASRSPRTPPPPWRTRRDRRPTRWRRARPARHGAAPPRRARPPRDCRTHAASDRRAPERGRDRGRSRRAHRRRRAPRAPRASGSGRRPGRARRRRARPLTAAPPSPAPAPWRNRARTCRACRRAASTDGVGHGAALDIDGAVEPPGAVERPAHLGEMAADLHHHRGVGVGKPPLELVLRQRAGQHGEHVVALRDRRADRRPAARHAGDAGARSRSDSAGRAAHADACRSRRTADRPRRSPRPCGPASRCAAIVRRGVVVEGADRLAIGGVRFRESRSSPDRAAAAPRRRP